MGGRRAAGTWQVARRKEYPFRPADASAERGNLLALPRAGYAASSQARRTFAACSRSLAPPSRTGADTASGRSPSPPLAA